MVGSELAIAAFVHPTLDRLPDNVHLPVASALARVLGRFMPFGTFRHKSGGLPSEKKRGNDRHVKRCSPVNIDGRRKAKMAENDQPITERDENCNGEEYCGGAPVSPPEERPDYETRKDVANSLDPHKRKGGGVVDRNAEGS